MPHRLLIWSFASFLALAPLAGEFACLLGLHPCCLQDRAGGSDPAASERGESLGGGEPQGRGAGASSSHLYDHHAHHGDVTERQGQGGGAVGKGQDEHAGQTRFAGASHQPASDDNHGSKTADCRTHCDAGGRVAARERLPRPLVVDSQRISAAVPPSDLTEAVEHVPLRA